MIQTVCDHLYACAQSPKVARRRAKETRETVQKLVKQARELRDRADVLMRETEVTARELRDAVKQSA